MGSLGRSSFPMAAVGTLLLILLSVLSSSVFGFSPITTTTRRSTTTTATTTTTTTTTTTSSSLSFVNRIKISSNANVVNKNKKNKQLLFAGGFEWEDPTDELNDPGVENPFKKKDKDSNDGDGDGGGDGDDELKVDAARLLAPRLQGSNVYLVGMMGSGKSSVGDIIARRMGTYNFLDTDEILEKAAGMTIPEIFESEGEESFRELEAQILDSVHAHVRCVISTGGGVVCRLGNWSKLQTGVVVWLSVDPKLLWKRIEGTTNRPLILQSENPLETLQQILKERESRYGQADVVVEITEDMDADDVANKVVRALHDFIDENPPAWKLSKAKAQAEGLDWVQ